MRRLLRNPRLRREFSIRAAGCRRGAVRYAIPVRFLLLRPEFRWPLVGGDGVRDIRIIHEPIVRAKRKPGWPNELSSLTLRSCDGARCRQIPGSRIVRARRTVTVRSGLSDQFEYRRKSHSGIVLRAEVASFAVSRWLLIVPQPLMVGYTNRVLFGFRSAAAASEPPCW